MMKPSINVLGTPLMTCSHDPKTGWFRDGYCRTDDQDRGVHVVCAQVDAKFLTFTASRGNDLRRPRGTFPGLAPGDRWCLCASRWAEAQAAGVAPPVVLEATQQKALKIVPMRHLERARVASGAAAPAPRR